MKVAKQTTERDDIIKNLVNSAPLGIGPEKKAHDDLVGETEKFYPKISHNTISGLYNDGFHDWMRIDKYTITGSFGEDFKKRYEAYVQGYILYFEQYDNVTGIEDRTIYFDWGEINKEFDLTIYMKPLYVRNYKYDHPMSKFPSPNPPSTVDPPKLPKVPPPYPS